jgi:hypothetical protein
MRVFHFVAIAAAMLAGCATTDKERPTSYPPPSQAGFTGSLLGLICPADTTVFTQAESAGFATETSCNASRAAPGACNAIVTPPAAPNATCNTYCARNWWPCTGSIVTPGRLVGNACYPKPDGNYYFMCVGTATCHCL